MKKTNEVGSNYTRVCSNVYKTLAGTYRVRVGKTSKYFNKRSEALKCRRELLAGNAE